MNFSQYNVSYKNKDEYVGARLKRAAIDFESKQKNELEKIQKEAECEWIMMELKQERARSQYFENNIKFIMRKTIHEVSIKIREKYNEIRSNMFEHVEHIISGNKCDELFEEHMVDFWYLFNNDYPNKIDIKKCDSSGFLYWIIIKK
jgi:hypothetical protein